MNINMDGIKEINKTGCLIIVIDYLSDEIKLKIKDYLVQICHGDFALNSYSKFHSFNETVKELVDKRLVTANNKIIGYIGEILLNVIIREYTDLKIVSPFFNQEQREPKKGFDIIASSANYDLWFVESKAGEINKKQDSTQFACKKIKLAKSDLFRRLNNDNAQLWLNAINSVRNYLVDGDEKKTVLSILEKTSNANTSNDKNVILSGIVFGIVQNTVDVEKIIALHDSIQKSKSFSNIQIIIIQKKTFKAVLNYLNELKVGIINE